MSVAEMKFGESDAPALGPVPRLVFEPRIPATPSSYVSGMRIQEDVGVPDQEQDLDEYQNQDENQDERPLGGDENAEDDEWSYAVTPYLWALSLKGNVTIKGQKSELDLSFKDILDDLDYGFFVHQEAWNGSNGVMMDVFVANLQADSKVATGAPAPDDTISLDSDVFLSVVEADYLVRLDEDAMVDAFIGARWTYERVSIRGSGISNVRATQAWVDPVIGARKTWRISERDALRVRADVGGLGVNNHSSWQVTGGWARQITERGSIDIGARVLSQDYKSGSGDDEFRWNARMVGVIAGWSFRF